MMKMRKFCRKAATKKYQNPDYMANGESDQANSDDDGIVADFEEEDYGEMTSSEYEELLVKTRKSCPVRIEIPQSRSFILEEDVAEDGTT